MKNKDGAAKEKFQDEIARDVIADFKRRREARKSFELQWRLNMNFFIGNQFSEITPSGDIDDCGKLYFWQEREVFNHIAPIVETRLAKLGAVKPKINVRPATDSDNDVNAAKFSARIIDAVFERADLESASAEANVWSEICGTAFYKVGWNLENGLEPGAQKAGKAADGGEIDIVICPPFEIYPDSNNAPDIKSLKSLIHAKAYPLDEIKEIWGVDAEADEVSSFSADNSMSAGGLGYTASIRKMIFERKEKHAYVIERYTAPTKENPNGLLSIVAGGNLVYHGPLPFLSCLPAGYSFPFIRQTSLEQAGYFFGASVIERLIPIQRAYNAVRNRKHEFLNRIAMGVLAVEDGSVDTDNLEEEGLSPGKVLIYRQGSRPPQMLDMSRVPGDFNYEEEKLMNEFVVISGVSDVTKYSSAPSNMSSGIALSLLIEQDETRLNLTVKNIRSAIRNVALCAVGLYKRYASEKKLKAIAKEGGELLLKAFKESGLTRDDIIVENDSDISDTPAARRNMVVELLRLGLLTDENGKMSDRARARALEALGLGNWENSRDLDELHLRRAANENLILARGFADASRLDNHELHISEHVKFMLSGANAVDAELRERVERHVGEHKRIIALESAESSAELLKRAGEASVDNRN